MNYRVILYHKQATSARTRFLKHAHGSVLAFEPLPELAQLRECGCAKTVNHPAAILQEVEAWLRLPEGCLKVENEYRHSVEVPGESVQVMLAEITTMDPPFKQAESRQACFIDLTQARSLPPVELELLRHAYELLLGG